MARVNLDTVPGARSVRRIRQTIHSEIADNKSRLDHLGQDTAVLLKALMKMRAEVASLALAVEDTKRRIADAVADEGRLAHLEVAVRELGEQLHADVESHDQQSFSRLSAVRRELVSLGQTWDWSEDRAADDTQTVENLCNYLAPLLNAATAIEFAPADASWAAILRAQRIAVVALDADDPAAPPRAGIDALQREQGWDGKLGLVRLVSASDLTVVLDDLSPACPEVLILDYPADREAGAELEPLLDSAAKHDLRRWIALIRRPEGISFTVNPVSLPSSTAATVMFVRDRDTFMAVVDWCSRRISRRRPTR